MTIHPIQSRLLIELRDKYRQFSTGKEQFGNTKTRGVVTAIAPDLSDKAKELGLKEGQVVYFGAFEDTAPILIDGKNYALIKLEEIGGWSDDES